MAELLQEYELSIWEDIHQTVEDDKTGLGTFGEKKIAVIGSHNLHTPTKAYNVSLKENVNGEKTLTFSLPRAYRDKDGELKDNPFLSFLTAERKLKLREGAEYDYYENGQFKSELMSDEDDEERWSDYIIKTVDEDKESFVNNYTCKEIYVNELGKNGWSVVLDSKLENNYGNLTELATRVLEGSDWTVDTDSYNPAERVNEPLFVAKIGGPLTLVADHLPEKINNEVSTLQCDNADAYIYAFYSQLELTNNQWRIKSNLEEVQIMWNNGALFSDAQLDDNRTVIDNYDEYNYLISKTNHKSSYSTIQSCVFTPTGGTGNIQTSAMQGGKIIQSVRSHYEPVADKYVEDYERKADKYPVYHYVETKMVTSEMVGNLIANANGYTTLLGWETCTGNPIDNEYAELETAKEGENLYSYLIPQGVGTATGSKSTIIRNQGLTSNRIRLIPGHDYCVRLRMRTLTKEGRKVVDKVMAGTAQERTLQIGMGYYNDDKNTDVSNVMTFTCNEVVNGDYGTGWDASTGYPQASSERPQIPLEKNNNNSTAMRIDEEGYYCFRIRIDKKGEKLDGASGEEIYFFIQSIAPQLNGNKTQAYNWIKDIQVFDYIEDENGLPIYPTDIPTAAAVEQHHFYSITTKNGENVVKDLSEDASLYTPVYNSGCQAIRHIDVKESNYFNNINSLAELFGVWAKFKIKHQKNGALLLENGEPIKTVKFTRFASPSDEFNWSGFRYGINLKSIKRSVESTAIASKVIVKNNNNEFATAGMGSISRAENNPTGENVIYNFDYYVAHGLLDSATLVNDLYGTTSTHFGLYRQLRNLNDKILPMNEQLVAYQRAYKNAVELYEYADESVQGAQQEYEIQKSRYDSFKANGGKDSDPYVKSAKQAMNLASAAKTQYLADKAQYEKEKETYDGLINGNSWNSKKKYKLNDVVKCIEGNKIVWYRCKKAIAASTSGNSAPSADSEHWAKIPDNTTDWTAAWFKKLPVSVQVDYLKKEKQRLILQFYKKYSRFIQEATWTDEKYMDDNLYYYDAIKVSNQNAWPKTKYTIGVIDVRGVERLAAYSFAVGQKSYVEDTEFFGYENISLDGKTVIKTPKKKEVIVSECTRNFDDPSKSTITVQTYKNQFEELFSKLTATTQSLQYSSGEYQRAANTVQADGSIAIESLEQAFANNAFILGNSANQLVSWDSGSGIEVADAKNPTQVVRITSAGIMLTADAGRTWSTGITANGINTALLTAGTISADKIRIVTSDGTSSAFSWDWRGINAFKQGGTVGGNDFVRFDQYGIYGTTQGLTLDEAVAKVKTYEAKLAAIKANSTFSITWDGLLLNYQEGATSLSQLGGLEIFNAGSDWVFEQSYIDNYHPVKPDGRNEYKLGEAIPVVSVGRYYTSPAETGMTDESTTIQAGYGLRLRNKEGYITLDTNGNDGNLWLRESLTLGNIAGQPTAGVDGRQSSVDSVTKEETPHAAFWAGPRGIDGEYLYSVGHDGSLIANEASIRGGIRATNLTVDTGSFIGEVTAGSETLAIEAPLYKFTNEVYTEISGSYEMASTAINSTLERITLNSKSERIRETTNYAFWAGPTVKEYEVIVEDEAKTYSTIEPRFSVDMDGHLIATDANITGEITATSGSFTGTINALSGSFKGSIEATSGFINQLYLCENEKRSYIGAPVETEIDDATTLLSINNDNLLINGAGDLFANKIFLHYREEGDRNDATNYYLSIGNDSILTVSSTLNNKIFEIDKDANIIMSGALNAEGLALNGNMDLHGKFNVYDKSDEPKVILQIDGESGVIRGNKNGIGQYGGWSIAGDGSAEFENAHVRGKISSVIFETQKTSAVGGSLLITPAIYITKDLECLNDFDVENPPETYDYRLPVGGSTAQLWLGIKQVMIVLPKTGAAEAVVKNNYPVECSLYEEEDVQFLQITMSPIEEGLLEGTQIISTDKAVSAIDLSASSAGGPRIMMNHSSEEGETTTTHRVVIGSLNGFDESIFNIQNKGYGLYADNAYITGHIYLPNAGLTNELAEGNNIFNYEAWSAATKEAQPSEQDNAIRFWAGIDQNDRTTAPLVITQDGSLYAKKGIFSGQVIAKNSSFSGTISAAGVILSHNNEKDIDAEHQSFTINWVDEEGSSIVNGGEPCKPRCEFNIASFNWDGLELYRGLQFITQANQVIFKVIPDNIPRLVATEYQAWKQNDKDDYSTRLTGNSLVFSHATALAHNNYNDTAAALLQKDRAVFSIEANEQSTEIAGKNPIHFAVDRSVNLQVHKDGVQFNSKSFYAFRKTLTDDWQEKIEVKTVEDGIVFNYVGDE